MSVFDPNSAVEAVSALPHLLSSLPLDESSVSVLAMLVGIIGGWTITGWHQKMKAEKVKMASRRRQNELRK